MLHKSVSTLAVILAAFFLASSKPVLADQGKPGMVTVMHYFTGNLGRTGLNDIFIRFQKHYPITVFDNPTGHENFKEDIIEMAEGGFLPDMFSYWAGARTQYIVDKNAVHPIDDLWEEHDLSAVILPSIEQGATRYDGKRYLIPFGYHLAGLFFNPKVLKTVGIAEPPKQWGDLVALCRTLHANGIVPIALGAKNRWPAQFWFDYLFLRTAGPDRRKALMDGTVSYQSDAVKNVFDLWNELLDAGCFNSAPNRTTWTTAADMVARGDAAMTLMGTWITGYWDGKGLKAGRDYDFFEFPTLDPSVSHAAVGPVDGFLLSANGANSARAGLLAQYLLKDVEAQKSWVRSQGALSPNKLVPAETYNSVQQKALSTAKSAETFAFNYDLAAPPPMAEAGLALFSNFLEAPKNIEKFLIDTDKVRQRVYGR